MLQKAIITFAIFYTVTCLWDNQYSPVAMTIIDQPIRLDAIIGLALGVWFTK